MRKFSVLIALALLAVSGSAFAVTCAYDNVPAGTLLVPHFRVSRNGSTGGDIPEGGVDTLCSITNVSNTGIIVHITVYNKYSKAVLDFNVPMTAYDVAFFRMKDVMNGKLNVNPNVQNPARLPNDPCGLNTLTGVYAPATGFAPTRYTRFPNPDAVDAGRSISIYAVPAFSGSFRTRVWDSLDESGDITTFTSPGGANILDTDNGGCFIAGDGSYSGDFSGYLTLDVVNYCTNYFPTESFQFYTNDAIATVGWTQPSIGYYYTPNTIIGDIFYIDPAVGSGNISGDPMVALEFDSRLNWNNFKTFFGRHNYVRELETPLNLGVSAPVAYQFFGDGREPLGQQYAFRYLSDSANGLRSWAIIWRGDVNFATADGITIGVEDYLCFWYLDAIGAITGSPDSAGFGFHDSYHALVSTTYDNDENTFVIGGGPSGGGSTSTLYVFLETQRINLLTNGDINPGAYTGGWINMRLPGLPASVLVNAFDFNQAYVGIQHSGPGLALSVGHSAALMNKNQFLCSPALYIEAGNTN